MANWDEEERQQNERRQTRTPNGERRRRLDVGAIKAVIIFVTGALTAMVGALTGLGAQVMFAPMLTWMLGYADDKAQGTAMCFAAWTAFAAIAGAYIVGAVPPVYIIYGLLLVSGSIVGAILTAGLAKRVSGEYWRRTSQSIGIMLTLAVIVQVAHSSTMFAGRPNLAEWNSPLALLLIGLIVGACTQILGLTSGALLVPALYFFSGLRSSSGNHAIPAVILSIMVIAMASLLPALAYAKRGLVDGMYRTSIITAGLIGGFAGGLLSGRLTERAAIIASAVIAMFLCARELSRFVLAPKSE